LLAAGIAHDEDLFIFGAPWTIMSIGLRDWANGF